VFGGHDEQVPGDVADATGSDLLGRCIGERRADRPGVGRQEWSDALVLVRPFCTTIVSVDGPQSAAR
jgi:hypothetical protein